MLKQILQEKIKQQQDEPYSRTVIESKKNTLTIELDPEIEMVLPMLADDEAEYNDYRFLLGQLKRRNLKAFKKIVNLD